MNGAAPRCPICHGAVYIARSPEPPRTQRAPVALIFSRPSPAGRTFEHQPPARRVLERQHRLAHQRAMKRLPA